MRVRIPIPPELALPLAIAGWVIMALIFAFFTYDRIKTEGKTGWLWFAGVALLAPLAVVYAFFAGQQGGPDEPYYATGVVLGLVGLGSAACLFKSGRVRTARWVSRLAAVAVIIKSVVEPPLLIIFEPEFQAMPAPYTHPMNLLLFGLVLGFLLLGAGFWERHLDIKPISQMSA